MDVQACDDCKKLNTELPLFVFIENNARNPSDRDGEISAGTQIGLSLFRADKAPPFNGPTQLVCALCLNGRLDAALTRIGAVAFYKLGAAVQAQKNQQ